MGKNPVPRPPRKSLRVSIDEFCKWCIYDQRAEGRWREQVAACESKDCPLWPVRPKDRRRSSGEAEDRQAG